MKNYFLFTIMCAGLFFVSCEKDEDHHDECHECHIAFMEEDGSEHVVDIDGEFCGDDLVNLEANGWEATEDIMHDGALEYAMGEIVPASMIHCEEHAGDHDGHDHD